jgi:adenylate cyclase
MMREDEAGTLAQLKSLRNELLNPKVDQYSGRIVKTTGDGLRKAPDGQSFEIG